MKRALVTIVALGVVGASAYGYYRYRQTPARPVVMTSPVARGDIVDSVGATGTLQAVTSVQVGTQVSGTVMELHADFNSLVRKGQVIARLDPSLFETQIEQSRANLIRAQADLERLKVALDDARTKYRRAQELAARQLLAQSDHDAAEVAVRSAEAQIRSAQASVTQAQASLNQSQVNLEHTIITAPIDGLVVSRNVDVGQTVAASMNAPTLFVLAADLTKMQVIANLDESDVGRIRPGQHVTFRVDAYPAEDFTGKVAQVRLQPIVQQNVVTYATVIDVSNAELKLKPGMTANVNVQIARRTDVIRVPNAALRFRPTNEIFAALGQSPGDAAGAGGAAAGPPGNGDGPTLERGTTPAAPQTSPRSGQPSPNLPVNGEGAGAGASAREAGRSGAGRGRGADLTPEERSRVLEAMRARGLDPAAGGRDPGDGRPPRDRDTRGAKPKPAEPAVAAARGGATTIDALFGPLPEVESTGRVWIHENDRLRPVRLRLGITDGQGSELLEGDLEPGMNLVTSVTTGAETTRPQITGFPPFIGGGRGGFGGGVGGGGTRGGGGNNTGRGR